MSQSDEEEIDAESLLASINQNFDSSSSEGE
jgi:hypothetical protein